LLIINQRINDVTKHIVNNSKEVVASQSILLHTHLHSSQPIDHISSFYANPPPDYWEKAQNRKQFIEWAAKQLQIKEQDDWYKIPAKKVQKNS
jgi:hypothetical protein